jgi:hypothetical protein
MSEDKPPGGRPKKIEIIHLRPSELKHNFGNPRKITKQKIEELKKSLEQYGDHDVIKIDEDNNIISGNQRVKAMIDLNIDTPILCKKLIGYSEKELKKINIESNRHAGEWDYDKLDEWEKGFQDYNYDIPSIEGGNYLTTTQKSKYLQDNMMIKIGGFEIFIKKDKQPKDFDVFYKEFKEEYRDIIIKGVKNIANEILCLV